MGDAALLLPAFSSWPRVPTGRVVVLTKVRHLSFARRTGGQPFLLDRNTFISITEWVLYDTSAAETASLFLGAGAIALPRRYWPVLIMWFGLYFDV